MAVTAVACGSRGESSEGDIPDGLISRETAIETAFTAARMGFPGASGMTDPHDPVAELMAYNGEDEPRPLTDGLRADERYVWVVQLEGESYSTRNFFGTSERPHGYAIAFVDANTNEASRRSMRHEPFFQ
jgi:hypothetical protein